ncbi:MAG: transposase [Clostridiales bacterium]|nr:transposase [Clostridiales bacterium]
MKDQRLRPQIPAATIFFSVVVMMATRLGSLNALEQEKGNLFWRKWLKRPLPSADTMGRGFSRMDLEAIRSSLRHVYLRLKRNKAIPKTSGFHALVLDGHESSASYLRCCPGCLQRTVHTQGADRTQYYHRNVVAMLLGEPFPILLDVEELRPGEDEVAATRLSRRVLKRYPRAFKLAVVDGLYLRANFFQLFLEHGKDIIAVLKDENRDLLEDARALFPLENASVEDDGKTRRQVWDIEGFESWESLGREIRVVRSVETRSFRRQLTGQAEQQTSEWIWATTLSREKASTSAVVRLGHLRWRIENRALNEMVISWSADHVYRHHPTAITAFWLTLMLVLNLFRAFLFLNIKPCRRAGHSQLYFARLLFSDLCRENSSNIPAELSP